MKFTSKSYLPLLKRVVRYESITNENYFQIIKFILNDDNEGLSEYFEWILSKIVSDKNSLKELSNVEKLIILLDNRSLTIGDKLQLKSSAKYNIELSINTIKNEIINNLKDINFKKICYLDNLIVYLSIPKSIILGDIDKIYEEIIDKIEIDGKIVNFFELTKDEKDIIINNIPAEISIEILNFIKSIQEKLSNIFIINKNSKFGIESIPLNVFDNTIFLFLKSLFKDDLMNFYELQFNLIYKMNITYDHFMKMCPNECKIYVNFYNSEMKKQEETQNKGSSSSYSMPNMPSVPKFK